ncbi:MAG: hypothetical protein WCJ18_12520 [Planctomycetota bacterium]
MFIEQSAERIRLVRALFVLAGLLPCAALVTFAVWWNSARHVTAIERECAVALGMPVEIGRIEHLRPGALRLEGVTVRADTGELILQMPTVDVESSATEIRLATGRLECTPRAVAFLTQQAGGWLGQPERFSKALVIDVSELAWRLDDSMQPPSPPAGRSAGIHAECVSVAGVRAVRVRREPQTTDEIRVQSTIVAAADAANAAAGLATNARRLDVQGVIDEPLPAAIVAALAQLPVTAGLTPGSEALVRGRITAVFGTGGWSGDCAGALERIDLATCTANATQRLTGEADVTISSLRFDRGRLVDCDANCSATAGRVSQAFLNAIAGVLGCRAGPAFRSLASDQIRSYDDLACRIRIDGRGLTIRAPGDRAGVVMRSQGLALLEEPAEPVPTERLAWLFSPPGRVPVPASDESAWLLSWLPISGQNGTSSGGLPSAAGVRPLPPRAERPASREEF